MNRILRYYTRFILFLFPIAFIPILADGFSFGKGWLLMISAMIGLILWIIDLLTAKEKIIKTNKVFWLLLITVIFGAVSFFRLGTGVQMRTLMENMGFGTLVSMFVWFFLWLQIADKEEYRKGILALTISGIIIGIVSLIIFILPTNSLPLLIPKKNTLISINASWSLTGSLFAEAILLLFLAGEWIKKLVIKIKEKSDVMEYIKEAVGVAFFGLIFVLDIYKIIKTGWVSLDLRSAWVIAVESLKNNPIFGMGIGNFVQAFTAFKPASFNLTKAWSNTFSLSSVGLLHIWTELGLVGLSWLIYSIFVWVKSKKVVKFWQISALILVCLLLPLNVISLFLLGWLLSTSEVFKIKETKPLLKVGEKEFNVMPYILSVFLLIGIGFGGFWYVRMFLGDFYFRNSLVAASKNDGNGTYNLQIKAIGINPNFAYYREIYSQTNLALAQNILSVEQVSDTDKEKASTLVQQAVREAKSAISLEENNAIYWSNLASIYRSLVGVVDGAADWSLQAYQQTLVLNPVDPITNLNMGGLFYAAGQYDSAERSFEESVKVKQDYANAWYNWAYSAKKLNKVDAAVNRLQQALTLVAADSSDYEAAKTELETWKQEQTELNAKNAQTQQTTQQTTQQATQQTTEQPKQVVETPIETVAPTAAVTPVVEVTPSPIVQP